MAGIRAGLIFALIFAFAAAGCIESVPESEPTDAVFRPTAKEAPPSTVSESPPAAVDIFVTASDCALYEFLVLADRAVFAPSYPRGVEGVHSRIVSASLELFDCRQAAMPSAVVENFQLATFTTLISTPSGGDGNVSNLFVHQAYTNSPVFATFVGDTSGWLIEVISTVSPSISSNPGGSKLVSLQLPTEARHYYASGLVDVQGDHPLDRTWAYVYGKDDVAGYFLLNYTGAGNSAGPGAIEYGSNSYWAQHSSLPSSQATTAHGVRMSLIIDFQPR